MSEPLTGKLALLSSWFLSPQGPPGPDVIPVPRGAPSSEQGLTQPDY